jgi:hypothetical protein
MAKQVTYRRKIGRRHLDIFLSLPFQSVFGLLNRATQDGGRRRGNPSSAALSGSTNAKLRHFVKQGGAFEP